MLTRILHPNDELCRFIAQLGLRLSQPQLRHVTRVADGVLVIDAAKTLAEIQRQFVDCVDVSNIADTFRLAPWTAENIRAAVSALVLRMVLQLWHHQGPSSPLHINLDDSLAIKDPDTRHLEAVSWHYDHAHQRRKRQRLQNALAYLGCNIVVGAWNFTYAIRLYLRAQTVRHLNRKRPVGQRLRFVSKYRLARQILAECRAAIPTGIPVYVHFDAWYASARLLKYIRRQGWHAVCRVRANRQLDGHSLNQCFAAQRHQPYVRVNIPAADGSHTTYLVRTLVGRLSGVPFIVRVLESRRHYRDKRPVYFISTDVSLSAQAALQGYATRWNCEVDHTYLKQRLGLGDFRLHSYEAIGKFCAVVHLAWVYVQWRLAQPTQHPLRTPADVIRLHRDEHAYKWLLGACHTAIATGDLAYVLRRFLRVPT